MIELHDSIFERESCTAHHSRTRCAHTRDALRCKGVGQSLQYRLYIDPHRSGVRIMGMNFRIRRHAVVGGQGNNDVPLFPQAKKRIQKSPEVAVEAKYVI